jgi:negative regulator of flagellin synthesis FlgM
MSVANKINDLPGGATAGGSPAAVSRTRGTPSSGAAVAPAGDAAEVHITDTATHLASLEQALRDTPAVDPARVAALRNAIEQGTYTIRPVHIATRFLRIEHALGGLAQDPAAAGVSSESR